MSKQFDKQVIGPYCPLFPNLRFVGERPELIVQPEQDAYLQEVAKAARLAGERLKKASDQHRQ